MKPIVAIALVAGVGVLAYVVVDSSLAQAKQNAFGGAGGFVGILKKGANWISEQAEKGAQLGQSQKDGEGGNYSEWVRNFDWENPNFDPLFKG